MFTVNFHWKGSTDMEPHIEYQEPHDSIRDGYYRIKIGWDLTIMASPEQVRKLREALNAVALDAAKVEAR